MNQIVVLQERCPVHAGELRSLIRMHQNLFLWLSPPASHQKRLQQFTPSDRLECRGSDQPKENDLTYAIIGFGEIGQTLARAFARNDMELSVATTRDPNSFAIEVILTLSH